VAKKKAYRYFLYLLLEVLRTLVLFFSRRMNYAIGHGLGFSIFWILGKERAKTIKHLQIAFPEKTERECSQIAERAFINLAKTSMDLLCFPKLTRSRIEQLVSHNGTEKLDRALARGKGVIALTGHLGNWELLASYFRFLGYPGSLLGRRIYYEKFNDVLVKLRASGLVTTIYRDESPRKVLAALKANHVIGISADQDIDSLEGIFVPFFGKPAWTPTGPAKLALASGAAIVPAFMIHEGDQYRLYLEDAILPDPNMSKEEAVQQITELWSQVVEQYVRRFPDQWVWMHNRWKTIPHAHPFQTVSPLERVAL